MPEPIIPKGTGWDKNTEKISESDIQIGAVEIKDHDSNTRADVSTLATGENALIVNDPDRRVRNVTLQTVTLTNADTEYSITIPSGTKRFSMQPRQNVDVRFAFESGKVATPTEPYATMKGGAPYTETNLDLQSDLTIYFASSTAGTVVEIIYWS